MSVKRFSILAFLIERAILLPVDILSSFMSEYGEPPTNGLDPATILALISNTLNSNLSVTIVSKQNGPIMPRLSFSKINDSATVPSAISNAFGSRDSLITTG